MSKPTSMRHRNPSKVSRPKRRVVPLVCLLITIACACLALEHWVLQVDRYRPQIVEAIEKTTGLTVYIGELDLVMFPTPHLSARDLSIGEGAFRANSQRMNIHIELRPLLRRHVAVNSIEIVALRTHIPQDRTVFIEQIESVQERMAANSDDLSSFTIDIESIRAYSARVYSEDSAEEIAVIDFSLSDVSGGFLLTAQGSLPKLGTDASVECEFGITRIAGAFDSGEGRVRIQNIDTSHVPLEGVPSVVASIDIDAHADDPENLQFSIEGDILSSADPVLTGPFHAMALWSEGAFMMEEITWEATGVTVNATAGITDGGQLQVHSLSADLSKEALEAFAPMLNSERVQLVALDDASVQATDIGFTWKSDDDLKLGGGSLRFSGVELALDDGELATNGLHGSFAFANDTIYVQGLGDKAFTLNGTLSLDTLARSLQVDLTGLANLKRVHIEALLDRDEIVEAEASVVIDRLSGTFFAGQGMPEDLILMGSIRDGRIVVERDSYVDTITPITASFDSDAQGIKTTLEMSSERSGTMRVEGQYAYTTHEWSGTTDVDVLEIAARLLGRDPEDLFYAPVLALYSPTSLATVIELPYREREGLKIDVQRDGTASLRGTAEFDNNPDGGLIFARVSGVAEFTLDDIETKLFDDAQVLGNVNLRFERDASTNRFETTLDMTEAKIQAGRSFIKQKGDLLRFTTSAETTAGWQYDRLQIEVLGETVTLGIGPESGTLSSLDIELALLGRLLPEGELAHGRIHGEVRLDPLEMAFIMDDASLTLAEGISIDSMTGGIRYNNGTFSIENMRLSGANSDCTLQGSWSGSQWDGEVRGKSLDLDVFLEIFYAVRSFEAKDELADSSGQSLWDEPRSGTFIIALDKVQLRRGYFENVRARIQAEAKRIRVRNMHAKAYAGSITGSMDIVPAENAPALVRARFVLDSVDTKSLDDFLFDEPRNIYGTLSGSLNVTAPLGDAKQMLAGSKGAANWVATDGSWGKLGFATKLLTALKTVEVINLRAPSLRDKGLVYRSFTGKAAFDDGSMTLSEVFLDGGAYAMDARGGINFSSEETNIRVYTRVLESVSRAVKWIPLAGGVVRTGTNQFGIAMRMSGSPYDMQAEIVPGGSVVGAGVGLVVKGLKKVENSATKLIPGVGRKKNPKEVESETPQ